MADKKQLEASKIDALYSWLSYDLQKMKGELLKELKYSAVQVGSLYQAMKADKEKSSQAISQEIRYSYKQNQTIYDGLATMLTREVGERLSSMDDSSADLAEKQTAIQEQQTAIQNAVADVMSKLEAMEGGIAALENVDSEALAELIKEKVAEVMPALEESIGEIKYSFLQHQAIYDSLTALITEEVIGKLDNADAKLALLEQAIADVNAKIADCMTLIEENDYKALVESVAEKTEESVAEHSRQVLDAVAAIPVAENVDYNRIVDEVGDKVLELLGEVGLGEPVPAPVVEAAPAKVDYDKIIYGTAEKVVESLPYPEKVNYNRIEDTVQNAVDQAIAKLVAALNVDAIAAAVAQKIEIPQVDYDLLSDMVAEKLAANTDQSFDVVLDETGVDQIADKVSEKMGGTLDYDRIASIVEEKLSNQPEVEPTYEIVVDEEGVQAIAKSVSEELCQMCATCEACEPVEEVVEETVEEVVEEVVEEQPVEEAIEEVVEETVEEVVEEQPVEEVVEETVEEVVEEVVEEQPAQEEAPVSEEIAVSAEPSEPAYDELTDQLVDAETGLVIRLKRSFTAKLKQSEEKVKEYYSDIKNELTSYKKINSNISWHGDRFNYGRDTVAKVNICGKTLCFYLALDPENPEYKSTVYHQKNVGDQKAYESTPFMVKIKSDAAAKKALRLVGYLAEQLGAVKEETFQEVNYVEEFSYATTKELYDAGYIKATKEKKVDLDF